MKKKKKISIMVDKEECSEDYCFVCKDGGHLRVCDYKNCLKAYHPECVEKDPSFLEADEHWTCGWHSCFICQKNSAFQCYCCPSSVCRCCLQEAEFVQVKKKTKGFCTNCLKLAILIEENIDVDSDGEKVDFRDRDTYECLFKEYWEIIKDQDRQALVDFQAASAYLKEGANIDGSDSDGFSDFEENSDDERSFIKDLKWKHGKKGKAIKGRSKKTVFTSWGSSELIDFLTYVGKDTKEPLTLLDVSEIIKKYVEENNLHDSDSKRKKNIICDKRLHALFGKKRVKFHKVYTLLEDHFAENAESDDVFSSSSEEGDNNIGRQKKQRITSADKNRKWHLKNCKGNIFAPPKSCFASIVAENISSVYLKKSLVVELLASPGAFDGKVIGCFVRVKLERKDSFLLPKKMYKLGQVTGAKNGIQRYKIGETSTDVVLHVSDFPNDVQISMLSEDDFEEDECEELRQLANKGCFRMPTVRELEEKIRSVHTDIMNHWIDKEIVKLQRLIDRANEKGWRRELFEYIDKREKLRTPEERRRLLQEIPPVITETEEHTNSLLDSLAEDKGTGVALYENTDEEVFAAGSKPLQATEGKMTTTAEVIEIEDDED